MDITEVRIYPSLSGDDRLLAFVSITIDRCFAIHDLRIIRSESGPFVAMPSRKLTFNCPDCQYKNPLDAAYCGRCGCNLPVPTMPTDFRGKTKVYIDVCHPVTSNCREALAKVILEAYNRKVDGQDCSRFVLDDKGVLQAQ